jgi:hypothetical protein
MSGWVTSHRTLNAQSSSSVAGLEDEVVFDAGADADELALVGF